MKINNLTIRIPKRHLLIRFLKKQTANPQPPTLIHNPKCQNITTLNILLILDTKLLAINPGKQIPAPTSFPILILFLFLINLNSFQFASPDFGNNRSQNNLLLLHGPRVDLTLLQLLQMAFDFDKTADRDYSRFVQNVFVEFVRVVYWEPLFV
jgi:hypothetical protein